MPEDEAISPETIRQQVLERLNRPMSQQDRNDMSACAAIDSLGVSLRALRMALDAANQALGLLGLPDERGHLTEGCEMRGRWCAAIQLLTAAITTVETDGGDVIKAVKTMLALE